MAGGLGLRWHSSPGPRGLGWSHGKRGEERTQVLLFSGERVRAEAPGSNAGPRPALQRRELGQGQGLVTLRGPGFPRSPPAGERGSWPGQTLSGSWGHTCSYSSPWCLPNPEQQRPIYPHTRPSLAGRPLGQRRPRGGGARRVGAGPRVSGVHTGTRAGEGPGAARTLEGAPGPRCPGLPRPCSRPVAATGHTRLLRAGPGRGASRGEGRGVGNGPHCCLSPGQGS